VGLRVLDRLNDLIDVDVPEHMVKHIARDPDDRDADANTELMQDLLLAQKRGRPAYCFQHLDLELRTNHDGAQANTVAGSASPAPWHDVVACFATKWNSHDVNKTRSFNILAGNSLRRNAQFCCIPSG
jgi:hypothetical protein